MVTAHEADILYMRNFLEEITQNKYDQGGATLKDLKPDTFESNEKSFRQRSDEFSSWVERIDQDFEKMLRLAAQMQEWDKDKFIDEAQQEYRLGAEKVAVCRVSCVLFVGPPLLRDIVQVHVQSTMTLTSCISHSQTLSTDMKSSPCVFITFKCMFLLSSCIDIRPDVSPNKKHCNLCNS